MAKYAYSAPVPLDPTGSPRLVCARHCPRSRNTARRRGWNGGCGRCPAGAAQVGFLCRGSRCQPCCWIPYTRNMHRSIWMCRVDKAGLTLGSALRPVRLPEGAEAFGAKALVASLRVLALLRTRAVNFALVHVCASERQRQLVLGCRRQKRLLYFWVEADFTFTGVPLCRFGLVAWPARTEEASVLQVGAVVLTDVVAARVAAVVYIWQDDDNNTLSDKAWGSNEKIFIYNVS